MNALAGFRRVGHQGRLRPIFDGAMAALLGRVPTHYAPTKDRCWRSGDSARASAPALQSDEVIE